MAEIETTVDTSVDVDVDVSAQEWVDAACEDEIAEMKRLVGDHVSGLDIDRCTLHALIEHLQTNEIKGVPGFKKDELIKQLYEIE